MILSTCGARAAGFHTVSFICRAACARRTTHQGAVVVSAAIPACRSMSRRVHIGFSPLSLVTMARTKTQSVVLAHQSRGPDTRWCGVSNRQARHCQAHALEADEALMAPLRQPRVAVSRVSGMVGKNAMCKRWDTPPYSPKA